MQAVDSLSRIISESESEQINQLLDSITVPAMLMNDNRQIVSLTNKANKLLNSISPENLHNFIFPDPAIWQRAWNRILQGHTVTTVVEMDSCQDSEYEHLRFDLSLSLLSANHKNYALCMISSTGSNAIDNKHDNLGKFPDENPNPVMRVSTDGRLLYANRASAPLLRHWAKNLGSDTTEEGHAVFRESIKTGKQYRTDINCGDCVYSVAFAPVVGSDYLNIYALDTTDKKYAEQALQSALVEVRELKNRLQQENRYLQDEIKAAHGSDEIIGNSEVQLRLLQKASQVADTDSTVLILGETGTGKELLARAIHAGSRRHDRPLVKVNCAALPSGLIESELFGHEKGAFTGAISRKTGRFEIANGGTIFLDEIGDLPLELQAKLLRVLQEGEIERVGSSQTIRVNVRIIAATNRNLPKSIGDGEFREDLFYRLNVFPVQCPPLRERKDDIVVLAYHFLNKYSVKIGKQIREIKPDVMARLQAYNWPGNVRELENVIERAIILTVGNSLQLDDSFDFNMSPEIPNGRKTIREVEQEMIQSALEDTEWKIEGQNGAATRLGMAPSTLRERIKKYGIQRPSSPTGMDYFSS